MPMPSTASVAASVPTRPSPSTSLPTDSFEFAIPTRLADFGRRISQTAQSALDTIDPPTPPPAAPPSAHRHADVPGMGDEPVMCPFCEKPLPPSLLVAQLTTGRPAKHVSFVPTPAASRSASRTASPMPSASRPAPIAEEPHVPVTAAALAAPVAAAERADTEAAAFDVELEDMPRWLAVAGLAGKTDSSSKATSDTSDDLPVVDLAVSPETRRVDQMSSSPSGSRMGGPDERDALACLREVLQHVQSMSRSHGLLLTSHSSLLTSLKIARSNLAMAESNSEMLAEQLKHARATAAASARAAPQPLSSLSHPQTVAMAKAASAGPAAPPSAAVPPRPTPPPVSAEAPAVMLAAPTPTTPSFTTAAGPPVRAPSPAADNGSGSAGATAPQPRGVTGPTTATPSAIPSRVSAETARPYAARDKARPMSLQLPANMSLSTSAPNSSSESKGMFNFLNGGTKKLPGGLGSVKLPSAAGIIAALPSPQIGTPGERNFFDWGVNSTPYAHSDNRLGLQGPGKAPGTASPALTRSASTNVVPQRAPGSGPAPAARPPVPPGQSELFRLRQSYAAAQGRMEAMATELDKLKKGKTALEAELENLSQALFEEANKMVSEERKKRGELEVEMRAQREEMTSLKDLIRRLGGQVTDERAAQLAKAPEDDASELAPPDLTKHYAALRKSIHHVAEPLAEDDPGEPNSTPPDTMTAGDEHAAATQASLAIDVPLAPSKRSASDPILFNENVLTGAALGVAPSKASAGIMTDDHVDEPLSFHPGVGPTDQAGEGELEPKTAHR